MSSRIVLRRHKHDATDAAYDKWSILLSELIIVLQFILVNLLKWNRTFFDQMGPYVCRRRNAHGTQRGTKDAHPADVARPYLGPEGATQASLRPPRRDPTADHLEEEVSVWKGFNIGRLLAVNNVWDPMAGETLKKRSVPYKGFNTGYCVQLAMLKKRSGSKKFSIQVTGSQ